MSWSFPIGRLLGSELRVHATFFLLIAWIGASAWMAEGPASAIVNIAFILALFSCVVAHEFGHALMARRFGIRTPDITLLPIGGMARLERMPEKPGQEIAVALAGPAVNVAIWAILAIGLGARTELAALGSLEDPATGFLSRLAAVNLFLVLFNMIPAFPMDGGRVLRALLATRLDRVRATQIAARAGQVIAFLFGFLGLTTGNVLLLLIAVFVFMAAAAESSDVALHARTHDVPARDAMITSFEALAPGDSLDTAARALVRTTQTEFPVVSPDNRLLGMLTRAAIASGVQNDPPQMRVSAVMATDIPALRLDEPLEHALDALSQPAVPAVAVTDARGIFLGYITRENIGEWMILRRRSRP
ncbi:site-2 protease family protein [Ovoidimarina sediminis]|uniref:site-2 protease family protein n=1 Tax=Ovoidimarina sediminis TaxID=3079856 RepID=UPI002911EC43|nr:site-2 protease family protein [Rhodophyticola sp. MJ-SS7]MDU8944930.1 site-2 protease family protein [Rhodophyticola sp. MJ-SS7]